MKLTKRQTYYLIALFALVLLLFGGMVYKFVNETAEKRELDGMVYSFIVGKVEGNDDLLADLLTEKAQGIIVPGRHAYPGAAKEMGERYEIVRYDARFAEGVVLYDVKFYRPSTERTDVYTVVVVNTDKGWRIAKNSSADNAVIQLEMKTQKGVTVHEYSE